MWMVGDSSSFVNVVCISLLLRGATVDGLSFVLAVGSVLQLDSVDL